MATGYPAILLLEGRLGVVIGAGTIAERKVGHLLEAGARVKVIAPGVTDGVRALADDSAIELIERDYVSGDLAGAAVVIASTDDHAINKAIHDEATALGVPVNVVDDVEHCTFIAPSIIRRGDLVIAISTGGTNPALAVRIRERLEREFGEEYERYLALIARLKATVTLAPTQAERAEAWYRVVDSDVFDLIAVGEDQKAYDRALSLLGVAS